MSIFVIIYWIFSTLSISNTWTWLLLINSSNSLSIFLPIIIAGMILGPVAGGMIGCASDVISYLFSVQKYAMNPIVTLGAVVVGVLPGIISKYIIKENGYKQIIVSGVFAHLFGSVIIKSIGLFTYYNWSILWRIPLYLCVIAPVEIILICLLYKNKSCRKILGWK